MSYPEHEKLKKVESESQTIGSFLDWLFNMQGRVIAEYDKSDKWVLNPLIPRESNINKVLAEYFEIDLNKLEQEKRDMIEELRALNHKEGMQ